MPRKLKHTEQMELAKSVLEFIDWQLEPTEKQKLVNSMLSNLDQRMGRQRGPKIIYTVEVMKLRDMAMDAIRNEIIAHTSGICDGSVKTSFKRLQQRQSVL